MDLKALVYHARERSCHKQLVICSAWRRASVSTHKNRQEHVRTLTVRKQHHIFHIIILILEGNRQQEQGDYYKDTHYVLGGALIVLLFVSLNEIFTIISRIVGRNLNLWVDLNLVLYSFHYCIKMFKFCQKNLLDKGLSFVSITPQHSPYLHIIYVQLLPFALVFYQVVLECFWCIYFTLRLYKPQGPDVVKLTTPCCQNNDWQEVWGTCDRVSVKCSVQFDGHQSSVLPDQLMFQFPVCPWTTC